MKKRVTKKAAAPVKRPAKKPAKKLQTHRTLKSAAQAIERKAAPKADDKARATGPNTGAPTVTPKGFPPRPAGTRWPAEILVGKRFRTEYGDLDDLARSIDDRGGLLSRIAITPDGKLIAGERRLKAWPRTKTFKDYPIPVHVMTPDSIIAGEWDENAKRKDFSPTEQVAILREIERQLGKLAKARMTAGTEAAPEERGRARDLAARAAGGKRRTIEKAAAVVDAAEAEPEKYGKLQSDMDRTGKVDGPFKRLTVMKQTEALRAAPPPLPMNGPYKTLLIDFPVPGETDKDQEAIDAAGRSFRGYPEMAVESCIAFAADRILPICDPDCSIWLTFPNYHIVEGAAHRIADAFAGFKRVTMLTWEKDKIGRGQVLRDKTEHAILITRGKPVFNVFGEDPPTTMLKAVRRENSRKPDELYALVERVTPAPRYAEIFSRGGRSALWDCHGDEVGKFVPHQGEARLDENAAHAAEQARQADEAMRRELAALESVAAGGVIEDAEMRALLGKNKWIKGRKPKLTGVGEARRVALLGQLSQPAAEEAKTDEPKQVRRTLPGRDAELIAFAEACGHVVSMTIDWQGNDGTGEHVGTCACGWIHREPRHDKVGDASDPAIVEQRRASARAMDDAITAHWKDERVKSPVTEVMLEDWQILTAVQAGRDGGLGVAARMRGGLIKRKRIGGGYVLTEAGEQMLRGLDTAIDKARAKPQGAVPADDLFNETPAAAPASDAQPAADEPAAAGGEGSGASHATAPLAEATAVPPAEDDLDIPTFLRRAQPTPPVEVAE
jgi:N6-adenosine-specific RNA methylase IME4